ncbi:MAG TPA: substrate-binding domain-containing protein [Candidatus Angelobacter sp.]|nr:substrate-binding domain-containing protein [Candidatus Angelobacter sp.]
MTRRIGLTRRRVVAVVLLALLGGLVGTTLHAGAAAPTGASLPDFTSAPYQGSAPASWAFEVTSGGIQPGQSVRFSFLSNGKPGDRTHSVSFGSIYSGEVAGEIKVAQLPVSVIPGNMCLGTGSQGMFSAVPNPYTQTVDAQLTLSAPVVAGTVLVYCFTSNVVGFPLASGGGYSIAYTEPGGTVAAGYSVLAATATTEQVSITDSGADVTDAGLGGSHIGLYDTAYGISVTGRPGSTYFFNGQVYDTAAFTRDDNGGTVTVKGAAAALPTPGCSPGPGTLCTDSSGTATGTVTITSKNPNPDYAIITGALGAQGETEPSAVSLTAGPKGASVPAPTSTAVPTVAPSGPAAPPTFDVGCNTHSAKALATTRGLGSREFFDLFSQRLMPAASVECNLLSNLMSFYGVTDELGLRTMFGSGDSPFAFVGTDRSLSSTEQAKYKPATGTISQIPVSLEPVVVTYNLNAQGCNVGSLNLRSQVLSAIMLGQVTRWNDKLITADNLGLASCNLPILVAHDIGTTSSIVKDYMSKRVPAWAPYRQPELADSWPGGAPVACTSNGSRPMALCVSGKPGMIGYGFYRDIVPVGLPVAAVDGPTGFWSGASPAAVLDGCTAAAGTDTAANPVVPAQTSSDWSNASLTDTALPSSYPICSFDFVVAATTCTDPHVLTSYQALVAFLDAALSQYAQVQLPDAGFAKLPGSIVSLSQTGTTALSC